MLEQVISHKAGWTRVAFGDVVRLSKARAKDPEAEGYERVVGLEHIDPGDLRIRRWADIADGTTFTSVFKPGQVLFGKRRAYQRKVAVADFAGVCSGDIYVLEPSSDALMPELLPFICQTDAFFDHAVGTSAGSLSPRTNWKSLADFEFLLPPIQEQARIVGVMLAADQLRGSMSMLSEKAQLLRESIIADAERSPESKLVELRSVSQKLSVGLAISTSEFFRDEGVPLIRNQNIRPTGLDDREMRHLDPSFAERHATKRVKAGDVVTTRTGANIGQTCVVPPKYEGSHTFTTLISRPDTASLIPEFLAAHMNSSFGRAEIEKLSTSGGKNNLNVEGLRRYSLALPPIATQRAYVDALLAAQSSSDHISRRLMLLEKITSRLSANWSSAIE